MIFELCFRTTSNKKKSTIITLPLSLSWSPPPPDGNIWLLSCVSGLIFGAGQVVYSGFIRNCSLKQLPAVTGNNNLVSIITIQITWQKYQYQQKYLRHFKAEGLHTISLTSVESRSIITFMLSKVNSLIHGVWLCLGNDYVTWVKCYLC